MKKRLISAALALLMCLSVFSAIPATANAAGNDESAYAAAFDEMRRKIREESYLTGPDWFPSSDISECSYTFYDIDKNGVDELIFRSEGQTGVIYTLSQNTPVLVVQWPGCRDRFDGINEYGYLHGSGASSASSTYTGYYRLADDGSSGVLVAEIWTKYSESEQKVIYTVETPDGTKTLSKAEAEAFEATLTAPDITLTGWKTLTDASGTADASTQPAGVFAAYRDILEKNRNDIAAYTWYGNDGSSAQKKVGYVSIGDIAGDSTPELLFITRSEEAAEGYTTDLRVFGYDGQAQALLTWDQIDVNAGGGSHYAVFTTKDGGFYVYQSTSSFDWAQYELVRYVYDGETLSRETAFLCTSDGETSPKMTYKRDGKQISASDYSAAMQGGLGQIDTLLMQSNLRYDPYWEDLAGIADTSMALSDAIDHLSGRTRVQAQPTASSVLVNGKKVAFDAYNIAGNNYFKLRDLAYVLSGTGKQFDVSWDGAKNAVNIIDGKAYSAVGGEMTGKGAGTKTAAPTTAVMYLDGDEVYFTAYNIDDNNYFKLRDVGAALDFGIDWDGTNNAVIIDTAKGY